MTLTASTTSARAFYDYIRPDVLVIYEVGNLTYGQDAANVLFSTGQRAASPTASYSPYQMSWLWRGDEWGGHCARRCT
jgi:hypothetical protein